MNPFWVCVFKFKYSNSFGHNSKIVILILLCNCSALFETDFFGEWKCCSHFDVLFCTHHRIFTWWSWRKFGWEAGSAGKKHPTNCFSCWELPLKVSAAFTFPKSYLNYIFNLCNIQYKDGLLLPGLLWHATIFFFRNCKFVSYNEHIHCICVGSLSLLWFKGAVSCVSLTCVCTYKSSTIIRYYDCMWFLGMLEVPWQAVALIFRINGKLGTLFISGTFLIVSTFIFKIGAFTFSCLGKVWEMWKPRS